MGDKMTRHQFKAAMIELAERVEDEARRAGWLAYEGCQEEAHRDADMLMMEVLRQHGFGEGCRVFLKMNKWYS